MSYKVSIIGLGLIGGSIALDLKRTGFATEITGVDKSSQHEQEALKLGIIDKISPFSTAIQQSDIIILATPVDASLELLPSILKFINPNSVVTDVGSTKSSLIKKVKNYPNRQLYVASHPMSGTENSGPSAAIQNLFKDKVSIICNAEESSYKSIEIISDMYKALGSKIVFMDSESHDEHVGYVSHLSHAISYALAVAVLEKEKNDSAIFNLASGGFASTVRLAKSSVDMWLPIFIQNSKYLLPIINTYLDKLTEFKSYLENGDTKKLSEFITEANHIKGKLEKK
ncbi:prephenate dehydrogenase [Apibacter adventoris]|uniref:prephenate dehydrogenase n=1 Tax=Apibacter adventoris TaxID=1679466 RepID=UPI000CF5E411|nr:prephenate dehydrogenase [Apibacter adventoris]PQL92530.1 prephenate dehydrogenase [Apibacter adventoris]